MSVSEAPSTITDSTFDGSVAKPVRGPTQTTTTTTTTATTTATLFAARLKGASCAGSHGNTVSKRRGGKMESNLSDSHDVKHVNTERERSLCFVSAAGDTNCPFPITPGSGIKINQD